MRSRRTLLVATASVALALLGVAAFAVLGSPEAVGFFALLFGPGAVAALLSNGASRGRDFLVAALAGSLTVGAAFGVGNERSNYDNAAGVVLVGTTIAMAGVALFGAVLVGGVLASARLMRDHVRSGRPAVGVRPGEYEPLNRDPPGGR